MSDDATPRLGLPYLAASQAQKHVTVNEALLLLDGLVSGAATSRVISVQPSTPSDGDVYLLPASPAGADWAGRPAGSLVRYEAGAWTTLPQAPGQLLLVLDENVLLVRAAAGWSALSGFIGDLVQIGVGTRPDQTNVFSLKGAAALFAAAADSIQVKLSKAATADTGSLLFQTNYSGRAEIGLCGDDALHVKVSPDGAAWTEAMVVDAASGRVGLGVSAPTSRLQVDGAVRVRSYGKAALPSASTEGAGAVVFVSDDTGGATLAFSDGTAWRRVQDRAAVA